MYAVPDEMAGNESRKLIRMADLNLVKVTEIFLVPSSFLVAALGTADTNPHRAGVSLLALIISVMWWVCTLEPRQGDGTPDPIPGPTHRVSLLRSLPIVFICGWLLSTIVHVYLWSQPLKV